LDGCTVRCAGDHTKIVNTAELVSGLQVLEFCRSAPGIFTMYSRGLSSPPRLQNHAGKSVQQVNEGSPAKWRLASN
jgi:hypothetical protein